MTPEVAMLARKVRRLIAYEKKLNRALELLIEQGDSERFLAALDEIGDEEEKSDS